MEIGEVDIKVATNHSSSEIVKTPFSSDNFNPILELSDIFVIVYLRFASISMRKTPARPPLVLVNSIIEQREDTLILKLFSFAVLILNK